MATIAENIQTLRSIKSDIKNAIIQKGGSVTDAFGTYAQAITDLPSGGGGGTEIEDALITRTIRGTYSNDRVSVVGDYAFYKCYSLTSVNMQNCTSVGSNAFANCTSLTSINIPLCTYIGSSAFYFCTSLTSVNLQNCTYIGSSAFYNCSSLASVNIPLCTSIGAYAFRYCSKLPSINLPLCTFIGHQTFANCSSISMAKLPICSFIGNKGFDGCEKLTQVYLNSVTSVTTITDWTFSYCSNLTSVYVPASLVDAFKTATNWSSISNKIVAYTEA